MNKIICLTILLGIKLCVISTPVSAAGAGETIAREGNTNGAAPCVACHGNQGQGNPDAAYPYLAGQPADYLVKQLQDFASKRRLNPLMQQIASALSAEETNAVADYYAQLPLPDTSANHKNAVQSETGKALATKGKWSAGVPACFKCHGDKGQGIAPHFPAISGQPGAYLKAQLENWQQGKRNNDQSALMQAVVADLNDKEISEVSEYLAAQSPMTKK